MNLPPKDPNPFVSRGGLKLAHALDAFDLDPNGLEGADLGCSTGGFTDCLLQRGARRVHAVDTAYGQLAWKLRQDDRVVVCERTNAIHAEPAAVVDLVVIDLGWTPQRRAIPAALAWLDPANPNARIISLIKPHYEDQAAAMDANARGRRGVLDAAEAQRIAESTRDAMPALGVTVLGWTRSPLLGSARRKGKKGTGNAEWLALLAPAPTKAT